MKKILLAIVLMLLLCGCDKTGPEYLVSSMGFDFSDGLYNVCFEAVVINSESSGQTIKLLKGKGVTIGEAVSDIYRQCTQPLMLSHCGVLAIGESVDNIRLREIGDYCYNQDQLTLSAFFVKTENAEKILSVKPLSSVCAGYDIMGLIQQNKQYNNRFFELINSSYRAKLPKIILQNGGLIFEG